MDYRERAEQLLDGRIPVAILVEDSLGGVTAWSRRLEKVFADHPKYRLLFVECPVYAKEVTGARDICAPTREDVADALRALRPAVVVPNYAWEVFDLCAELLAEGQDLRTIGFCRTDEELYYAPLAWYEPIIAQFAAVSPECVRRLGERLPARTSDIWVMPTGVWVPEVLERNWQCAPLRLVYGGRMTQVQKRVLDFIPLVKHLLALGVDFTLDLVGTGSQTEKLRAGIDALPHGGRVRFTESQPPEAMPTIWRAADVFLQTSEYEGTSNSMLESMAEGAVPLVTDASSGIRSVIDDGANGYVVPIGDMRAMAERIAALAQDPEQLERLGRAAHVKAAEFSMERYREHFAELLDRTLQEPLRMWTRGVPMPPETRKLLRPLKRRPGCPDSPTPRAVPMDPPPPREEPIVLVAAADDNFAMPLAAMVRSVLDHLAPDRRLALYVLDGGISTESKRRLLASWDDARLQVAWRSVGAESLRGLKVTGHVNALTYARLLVPGLLPESETKAIYLDCDMIVQRDLGELWEMDLNGYALLAVQDQTAPYMDASIALRNFGDCGRYLSQVHALANYRQLGIAPTTKYFNAGLLVLNLTVWRREALGEQVTEYIRTHKSAIRYWDQDGLNALLHARWAELDPRWNRTPHVFRYPDAQAAPFALGLLAQLQTEPWIIHYAARQKPWHFADATESAEAYLAALDRTAWAGWRPPVLQNVLRNAAFEVWHGDAPAEWECPNGGAFRPAQGLGQARAVELPAPTAGVSPQLGQRIPLPSLEGSARLVVSLQAWCAEPNVLALNVYTYVDGERRAYTRAHPGDRRWHSIRQEIDLPIGTDPQRVRLLIVLRERANSAALVAAGSAVVMPENISAGGAGRSLVMRVLALLPAPLRRNARKLRARLQQRQRARGGGA